MKIFYTTKEGYNLQNPMPPNSLGGYPSSNEVPNDIIGNLFGSISTLSLQQLPRDTLAIVLLNDETSDYSDITIYAEMSEQKYCSLELASVSPSFDSEDNPYIEYIKNSKTLPMYATFYNIEGEENEVNIGGLLSGKYIFLWLKRQVLDKSELFSDDEVIDRFNNSTVLPTSDTIELKISYNKI